MVRGEIDLNDTVVSPFFVIASGVQAGLFSMTLFGFDFASTIITLGSGAEAVEITAARIIAVARRADFICEQQTRVRHNR